ncbi:MAG: hypothetical protein ACRDZX_16280 [Acidimicrobiales bacterium]
MSEAPKNQLDEDVKIDETTAATVTGGLALSTIDQTPSYSLSRTTRTRATSPAHRAVRHAPLFALAAGAGLILVWGATHTSQSTLRRGTAEAGQVTLSSQQLLSQQWVQDGPVRSRAAGAPLPASVTVVATPPGTHR